MHINQKGLDLIKSFEGCRLAVYKDAVGVLTVGWGHTGLLDGKPMMLGQRITKEKAEELLKADMSKFEKEVMRYNPVYDFNENEFSALVSFAYNVGSIKGLTASGSRNRATIAEKMLLYDKAGGRTLAGLTRRRKAERELFLTKVSGTQPQTQTVVKPTPIVKPVETVKEDDEVVEQIKFNVDGKEYTFDRILKDGVNYVKLRDLANAIGAEVSAVGSIPQLKTKTVEQSNMVVDDKNVTVSRILKDGTNFVKLRDLANAIGAEVSNNGDTAIIKTK